eukprot:UN09069
MILNNGIDTSIRVAELRAYCIYTNPENEMIQTN